MNFGLCVSQNIDEMLGNELALLFPEFAVKLKITEKGFAKKFFQALTKLKARYGESMLLTAFMALTQGHDIQLRFNKMSLIKHTGGEFSPFFQD